MLVNLILGISILALAGWAGWDFWQEYRKKNSHFIPVPQPKGEPDRMVALRAIEQLLDWCRKNNKKVTEGHVRAAGKSLFEES